MATLNIKQFPDPLYKRLRAMAKQQHRSVAQQVIHLLDEAAPERTRSIFELEGVGQEYWRSLGMDAAEYIRRERDSWD